MSSDLLKAAQAQGQLRPVDVQLARWLGEIHVPDQALCLMLAAMTSKALGDGHVCLDLGEIAGQPPFEDLDSAALPSLADMRSALAAWPLVGDGSVATPLVLDRAGRLYLGRAWSDEHLVATRLRALAARPIEELDLKRLGADIERLFVPDQHTGRPDWQRVAAAQAVLRRLCLISGGPGTGKTTTVTAVLAALVGQALGQGARLRMALAAPTGKAAARLSESVAAAKQRLSLAPEVAERIPDSASTLHRLLGTRPGRFLPRHHAENPLHLDLLVIDEASMVDLPLMARTLSALPDDARLILLGDRDQLASVEAGAVLGDLAGRGREAGLSAELRSTLEQVTGCRLPPAPDRQSPPLADAIALLRHSRRFHADSGIGALAQAVRTGDAQAALGVLRSGRDDLSWEPDPAQALPGMIAEWMLPRLEAALRPTEPEKVLGGLARFRVLCALRQGPLGVEAVNRAVEQALMRDDRIRADAEALYHGRPVLIRRNDDDLKLFNGDQGVLLTDADGLAAWIDSAGGVRRVPPGRVSDADTGYAMTVHKSQGSEFDELVLILGAEDSRVLTRELLYTGITRARKHLTLLASAEQIRRACQRRVERRSGLYDALWGSSAAP